MTLLIAGLVVFIGLHLLPVFPALRARLIEKLNPSIYKVLFSLLSLGALAMIVAGLQSAPFVAVYNPPAWGRHVTMLLMLPALYLVFSTAMGPFASSAKVLTAHPMSWGVVVFSAAHLLANGDLAHVILFAAVGLYSLVSIVSGNARGMVPALTARPAFKSELVLLVVVLVAYVAIFTLHPYFTGVALV